MTDYTKLSKDELIALLNTKNAEVVANPDNLKNPLDLASYSDRAFALEDDGIYQVSGTRKKVIEEDMYKYWVFFEHGRFNHPVMIMDHYQVKKLAKEVMHDMLFKETPELLKKHRERHGFTQEQMAEHLGISRNYVSMIERGVADNMTLKIYEKIINYLLEFD